MNTKLAVPAYKTTGTNTPSAARVAGVTFKATSGTTQPAPASMVKGAVPVVKQG